MYKITEWDGTIETVIAAFIGGSVYITYLEGEVETHKVSPSHFWYELKAEEVAMD